MANRTAVGVGAALGVVLLELVVALGACGGGGGGAARAGCPTVGATVACTCAGGLTGTETCLAGGALGACTCTGADGGQEAGTGDAGPGADGVAIQADVAQPDVAALDVTPPDAPEGPLPRPIAPLSTSTVTFQLPTLRWELATGTDGVEVQICHDRACMTIEQTLDVSGNQVRPATPLAPGVHFWRLFARTGASTATTPGPTWEFFVGARSAAVDTSWGTLADFNGDGYTDVVASALLAGTASVYAGGPTGLNLTPTSLTGPVGSRGFGIAVASAGDLNGDGYADLVVCSTGGAVYIYNGGVGGLSPTPTTLTGPSGGGFGISAAGAGDVNGDGYADLLIAPGGPVADPSTTAYVYFGGATGLSATPATLTGPAGGSAYAVAGAGDVNGDGYADLLVGAASNTTYVYLGSDTGPNPSPTTLLGPSGSFFGLTVASAGDINGDGYADVVVGGDTLGMVYVYLGGALGLDTTPTILGAPSGSSNFGVSVAGAGDVNGDGYADVVVGDDMARTAYVYFGGTNLLSPTPTTLTGPSAGNFGEMVAGAGDIGGDVHADLVVGDADSDSAYVYSGGAMGVVPTPTPLTGPSGSGFGASVACAGSGETDGPGDGRVLAHPGAVERNSARRAVRSLVRVPPAGRAHRPASPRP